MKKTNEFAYLRDVVLRCQLAADIGGKIQVRESPFTCEPYIFLDFVKLFASSNVGGCFYEVVVEGEGNGDNDRHFAFRTDEEAIGKFFQCVFEVRTKEALS